MALRVVRTAVVAAAVLGLGACQVVQFIFGSVFPATVPLLEATADLSSVIPSGFSGTLRLRLVEAGSTTYVILAVSNGVGNVTAYVYDTNLSRKKTFTGLAGDGVMIDSSNRLVIGSSLFNLSDLSSAGSISPVLASNGVSTGADGFVDSSLNQLANITISSSTLNWLIYPVGWGSSTPQSVAISSGQSFNLDAVVPDASPTGSVLLAGEPQGGGGGGNNKGTTEYFAVAPKNGFSPASAFANGPHRDNLLSTSIGYVQGSILAYDMQTASFVRLDPATASTTDTFSTNGDFSNAEFAYSSGGGSFYVYDRQTRVLDKYAQWWK